MVPVFYRGVSVFSSQTIWLVLCCVGLSTAGTTERRSDIIPINSNNTSTDHDVWMSNSPCPPDRYGLECKHLCSPNCLYFGCNVVNGYCEGGCKEGWFGDLCEEACPQGFFGSNCTEECSRNCLADLCDPVIGRCQKGCNPGWVGRDCNKLCRRGHYGARCKTKCSNNCATRDCHHEYGYCLKGCKLGFWGGDCSLFGDIHDIPEPMRSSFYNKLSAESRSVLLYVLMGEYERTLETAQMEINRGIKQRNELKFLLGRKKSRN